MKAKFKRSFELVKGSMTVLKHNGKLLVFPLVSLVPMVALLAYFVLPLMDRANDTELLASNMEATLDYFSHNWILSGLIYLVMMFVFTFINVAFYHEILKAINQHPVIISRGFSVAAGKIKAIFMWSLLAGLVGIIIRSLEERLGFFGRWVMSLVGFAWSVASVFAIPVLIREKNQSNPVNFVKHSARMIKDTWGEGIVGFATISLVAFALIIGMFALAIILGILFLESGAGALFLLIGLAVATLLSVTVIYLQTVATNIYRCALYIYANEGVVPAMFERDTLVDSFKMKT